MAKSTRRALPLKPLPAINPLLSSQDTIPESHLGTDVIKDITKPRDLYTFLSLGYIPINTLQWPNGDTSAGINAANTGNKVSFSLSTIASTSRQWDDHISQNSYVQFDTHNPITGLPVLPAITRTSSASCDDYEDLCEQDPFEEPIFIDNAPRKSIINEEDHKIKISTTYIFAPNERLHETVKYNRNVALPKIKPKKHPSGVTSQDVTPRTNQIQKSSQVQATPTKTVSFAPPEVSPRKTADMHPSNYLFGMRPECLFLNNQLGERNPLLKSGNKESPSVLGPKASPGLNDLKDYDEYPRVYWQLRDGTIGQPEDLEADMIDRDLYRLRQISSLKLNTIERTFQVTQDPFRKWRGKNGEPIFSPRQQQRPCNRYRKDRKKQIDVPIYPQNQTLKAAGTGGNDLRLRALKINIDKKNEDGPLSSSRDENGEESHRGATDSIKKDLDVPKLGLTDDVAAGDSTAATPREIVAASLDTYRRLEEEREGEVSSQDVPIQKLHQLKGKREKKPIKTSLAHVDLDSFEAYRREHRAAPKRPDALNGRSLNNSLNRESFGQTNPNSSRVTPRLNTARSLNDNAYQEAFENSGSGDPEYYAGKEPNAASGKQPIKAPVATILFRPQSERPYDDNALAYLYSIQSRPGYMSPSASDASVGGKEKHRHSNTPLKPVHLEVFNERNNPRSPIKIPTGRTTYHPKLPSYKLDLVNYPPSNPRQSCDVRSNSAGYLDGRQQTQLTTSTTHHSRRLESSETRGDNQTGVNSGVNIRFGGQGKIIVSSSREGRRSR